MPEEVTYATLKFLNPSQTKKLQDSYSLKRTDDHEEPELEVGGEADSGTRRVENTVEVAESTAVRGHSAPSKMWYPVAFISLTLNLIVLAGLGALGLMYYHELIFCNRTECDTQRSVMEQLERNITLYMNIYNNVSNEHIILKDMLENTLKELKNFTSKYCEDLKQKENDLGFHSCSGSWIWHGDRKNPSSLMNMDNGKNWNRTQLFIKCLPSPFSWMDLNCTLNKTNQTAQNGSKFCILSCLAPP